jgi:hypothetical protein
VSAVDGAAADRRQPVGGVGTTVSPMPTLRPRNALTPKLVRREALQLSVVAALSLLALLFAPMVLRVVTGVVDIAAALLTAVACVVTWKAVGPSKALAVYVVSVVGFCLLAILNLIA